MVNTNRIIGYISISIVMIFGILFITGMVGDFSLTTRLLIGGAVLLYVLIRILLIFLVARRNSEKRSFSA